MPCTYYTAGEELSIANSEASRLKAELDLATRLLCGVLEFVPVDHSEELTKWSEKHLAADKLRLQKEKKEAEDKAARLEKDKPCSYYSKYKGVIAPKCGCNPCLDKHLRYIEKLSKNAAKIRTGK